MMNDVVDYGSCCECGSCVVVCPHNVIEYVDGKPKQTAKESAAFDFCGVSEGAGCDARHGEAHPTTGSRVVLTVAHLDHQPENCAAANLLALCQRCHNAYDAPMRRAGIKARQRAQMAVAELI